MNYKNITIYLLTKLGPAKSYIEYELNKDKDKKGLTSFHYMCFKGNQECLTTVLNYERECLKKYFSDKLTLAFA